MTTSWSFCLLCKNQNRKFLFLFFMTKSEVTRQVTIIEKMYHRVCWPSPSKHHSNPVSSAECLACQTLSCVFYIWTYVVCWRSCAYKDYYQSYIQAGKCLEYKHYRSTKAVADWINWRHKVSQVQTTFGGKLPKERLRYLDSFVAWLYHLSKHGVTQVKIAEETTRTD